VQYTTLEALPCKVLSSYKNSQLEKGAILLATAMFSTTYICSSSWWSLN